MLFDLKADPWELNNVLAIEAYAPICDALRERMLAKLSDLGDDDVKIIETQRVVNTQKYLYDNEKII